MKRHKILGLAGLLSAVVMFAASCGGAGGGGMEHGGNADQDGTEKSSSRGTPSDRAAMDNKYSDRSFIDKMVPHHRDAVDMAEVALENAEHEEVSDLAKNIVATQEAEIEELKDIKREEYGTSDVPTKMNMGQMEDMGMMMDPESLADRKPFDRAFIDAMVPHHESAVEMAGEARKKSDNPRIRELAENIVGAQEREISQMRSWRQEWYPEG